MRPATKTVISAGDITTSPVSASTDASQLLSASVQAVVTGTSPTGTLKLQCSNDGTNWTDLATQAVSATGTVLIGKTDLCFSTIRVIFAFTSGTGTVTVNLHTFGV